MGYFIAIALCLLPSAFGGGGSFPTADCTTSTCAWVQMGDDIDGEESTDENGGSVALNAAGDIMAVGARYSDHDDGNDEGHVRVFEWDGAAWNQMGDDIEGEDNNDLSGASVALNAAGDIVAIGAPENNGAKGDDGGDDNDYGHVRVFGWDGSAWNQMGDDINGEVVKDQSGYSVALNAEGDIVAIGAPLNNGETGSDKTGDKDYGHVRVFEWDSSAWTQMGVDIDGEVSGDTSGFSVALNAAGDIVAVGAEFSSGSGGDSDGQVRVLMWDGKTWNQMGDGIDGEEPNDNSGNVALNAAGTIVAVGAAGNNVNTGHVRVFEWDGTAWNQVGDDIEGEDIADLSGASVALNAAGDIAAVGAPRNNGATGTDDGDDIDYGHVRVFTFQVE